MWNKLQFCINLINYYYYYLSTLIQNVLSKWFLSGVGKAALLNMSCFWIFVVIYYSTSNWSLLNFQWFLIDSTYSVDNYFNKRLLAFDVLRLEIHFLTHHLRIFLFLNCFNIFNSSFDNWAHINQTLCVLLIVEKSPLKKNCTRKILKYYRSINIKKKKTRVYTQKVDVIFDAITIHCAFSVKYFCYNWTMWSIYSVKRTVNRNYNDHFN